MAEKKPAKKPAAKAAPATPKKKAAPVAKPAPAKSAAAKPAAKPAAVPPKKAAPAAAPVPAPAKRPAGPSARTCPLVLDGEVDASDFSPADCLTCGEFDCKFCEAEHGSGNLKSRLFAGAGTEEEGEEGGEGDGWDLDFGGEEEGADGDEIDGEGGEDPF